ncbi:MAG: glycoside hydrolase family 16 protein [Oscillospiraceae bacterium]|jgi:beta-glucanase (GH16 family)|nr:glycoside hydrolase family 16 protein [Oscillospiraceae bacterium]
MINRVIAWVLGGVNALLLWVGYPAVPAGQKLDLGKFELTWSDEFDGDALDRAKWGGHGFGEGGVHKRRDGYWCLEMARVEDGTLRIPSIYSQEGVAGGPAGYYSCGIETRGLFEQKFGYFEARAMLPKGQGLWSAFWLMPNAFGAEPGDGRTGAEIDVYESAYHRDGWPKMNSVSSAVHYGGYGDGLRSQGAGRWFVKRPYDTFHTYGLEWNENEYIFYIDGVACGRSAFGGVSQNPEWLILSVEHQFGGWAGDIRENKEMTDFVVDYVKAYQYKELIS